MTTHETQPETRETVATTSGVDRVETADPVSTRTSEQAPITSRGTAAPVETDLPSGSAGVGTPPEPRLDSSHENVDTTASAGSADQMLFADSESSGLRSRWTVVQSAFVDDPRDCVQKADGLVAEVIDKLTTGFAEARSRLEEQWARGEEASTEDLRVALKRYREFFERLLAV